MSTSNLTNWELSLKPVTERRVPTFERLLDRARALTAASVNWEPGKTVGGVQTFSLKPLQGKGPRWWARVSEHGPRHGKNAFDLMYTMFTKDRFENEKEYNKDLNSAQYLKDCQWGEVTHLEGVTPRVFWVISVPFQVDRNDIALSLFIEAGVTLSVCSVERIRELDGGKVEWLAASTMSPGGSIPLWLSEYYAIKRITAVVPKVDEFLDKPLRERQLKASTSRNATAATDKSAKSGVPGSSGMSAAGTSTTTPSASVPPSRKDTSTSTQEGQAPAASTPKPETDATAAKADTSAPASPSESSPPPT